jgi:hypothetical protein
LPISESAGLLVAAGCAGGSAEVVGTGRAGGSSEVTVAVTAAASVFEVGGVACGGVEVTLFAD